MHFRSMLSKCFCDVTCNIFFHFCFYLLSSLFLNLAKALSIKFKKKISCSFVNLFGYFSSFYFIISSVIFVISYLLLILSLVYSFSNSLPGGLDGKESAHNVGDQGSIPGLGRSIGEGSGNPLQYSCLENFMDREA